MCVCMSAKSSEHILGRNFYPIVIKYDILVDPLVLYSPSSKIPYWNQKVVNRLPFITNHSQTIKFKSQNLKMVHPSALSIYDNDMNHKF